MTQVDPLIQGILEAHGAPTPSPEWAESELGLAHRLINDVLARQHPEHESHRLLKIARDAVESADVEIETFRTTFDEQVRRRTTARLLNGEI